MIKTFSPHGAFVLLVLVVLSGCTINRDIMFKTPTDYEFDQYTDSARTNLKLQPNDKFQFRLFANDGFKMIDLVSDGGSREASNISRSNFNYYIESDGRAKLPLLGRTMLAGLTIREAETFLEKEYTAFYKRPYVQLVVNSRQVVVFPGGGGDAKVVILENTNTTLLEVLGLAGGVNKRGNASKVKMFRHDASGKRLVFQFDLSDINGLQYADIVMQGDDVVYVQPNPDLAREILADITPIITLFTSVLLVIAVTRNLQ